MSVPSRIGMTASCACGNVELTEIGAPFDAVWASPLVPQVMNDGVSYIASVAPRIWKDLIRAYVYRLKILIALWEPLSSSEKILDSGPSEMARCR